MSRKGGKHPAASIHLVVEVAAWRTLATDFRSKIRLAAGLALANKPSELSPELTILLTSDERVRMLNLLFRGKDRATNVLAFPGTANGDSYLGDIAVAYGVTMAEAKSAGKPPLHHLLHLVVHGALHLLGYDHAISKEAEAMESLETGILDEMGIPDPYKRRIRAA